MHDIEPGLSQIWADERAVRQICLNLLSNALKFTREGHVTLAAEKAPGADRVRVHVIDTGPGIAPELHELIFERFRQADARVSHQHGGTGLGLALARALAERMGGTLTLDSAPGAGSRFTLELPMRPPPGTELGVETPPFFGPGRS